MHGWSHEGRNTSALGEYISGRPKQDTGAKCSKSPPAVVTDHLGGGSGVAHGFAHDAGQATDE